MNALLNDQIDIIATDHAPHTGKKNLDHMLKLLLAPSSSATCNSNSIRLLS